MKRSSSVTSATGTTKRLGHWPILAEVDLGENQAVEVAVERVHGHWLTLV